MKSQSRVLTDPSRNVVSPYPEIGSGRAYALAWDLASRPEIVGFRPWLNIALLHLKRAVALLAAESDTAFPSRKFWNSLNQQFDLDSIVTFSHAWHAWENLARRNTAPSAWDQELFFGSNDYAAEYHAGIRELAKRQLDFVLPSCRDYLRTSRPGIALDLGAGMGVQMSALRDAGLITSAICVDTPYVVDRAREIARGHSWLAGDLRTLDVEAIPMVDMMWVGNLLHHYGPHENQGLVNRYAPKLATGGVLVVQEYVIGLKGTLGLSAAGLGVHFALTTSRGRNYPEEFIAAMLEEAVPGLRLEARRDGPISSLLFFRRHSQ